MKQNWWTWCDDMKQLLGADFDEISRSLLELLFKGGEDPASAARWVRIALHKEATPAGEKVRQG